VTQGPLAGDLPIEEFSDRLRGEGLRYWVGPFGIRLRARVGGLAEPLHRLYAHYPLLPGDGVLHFHVALEEVWGLRPSPGRRLRFTVDGRRPHADLPVGQALAVLEWGINLVTSARMHCYLMLHAAVLERGGRALLLPAAPGGGKTTLCVALAHRGWRLFSDEFGLLRPGSTDLVPLPRPMPLKNESIAVIRRFVPDAVLGPEIPGTVKGTIAHVRPPADSVALMREAARAAWIVFPRWSRDAAFSLEEVPRADGFMRLATNAFNFDLLGAPAFETVRDLVNGTRCFRLVYSDLEEAVSALSALADDDAGV
jgi:HprK-related kinase A